MKLRFRKNSLRLRVNQREADALATGKELSEQVQFPGGATLEYVLASTAGAERADFNGQTIRVSAPLGEWAKTDEIGFYFEVEPGLSVAIEKDLECADGAEEETDPYAYPRALKAC